MCLENPANVFLQAAENGVRRGYHWLLGGGHLGRSIAECLEPFKDKLDRIPLSTAQFVQTHVPCEGNIVVYSFFKSQCATCSVPSESNIHPKKRSPTKHLVCGRPTRTYIQYKHHDTFSSCGPGGNCLGCPGDPGLTLLGTTTNEPNNFAQLISRSANSSRKRMNRTLNIAIPMVPALFATTSSSLDSSPSSFSS